MDDRNRNYAEFLAFLEGQGRNAFVGRKRQDGAQKPPDSFEARLSELLEDSSLNRDEIYSKTGISSQTQWRWEQKPPKQLSQLWKLADWANVSRAWLLASYGPKDLARATFIKDLADRIERDEALMNTIRVAIGFHQAPQNQPLKPSVQPIEDRRKPVNRRDELPVYPVGKGKGAVKIPRWESVAAGFGEDLRQSEEFTYIRELPDWRGVHSIIVMGDSMLETLKPKDLILVRVLGGETGLVLPASEDGSVNARRQIERFVRDDGLYIVSVNDEPPTVKRIQYEGDGDWFLRLQPDNHIYKARTIRKRDHVVFWAEVMGIGDGKYA